MELKVGGDAMGTPRRFWWEKIKHHRLALAGIAIVLLGVLAFIFASYWFDWSWTGFLKKTLWDWLQLLIVPVVLALGAFLFNLATSRREHEIAADDQRAALLQSYLDRMSELLLTNQLRESSSSSEVRYIARARTLAALTGLDGSRKGSLIKFLYETSLINAEAGSGIINLSAANLHEADLRYTNLANADLSSTHLRRADLRYARLTNANLSETHLRGAKMSRTNLSGANLRSARLIDVDLSHARLISTDLSSADLSGANLIGADLSKAMLKSAKVTAEQLNEAKSLQGATLPDGSTHPE
jgi:uncharacterized protein YjbI with pentapeptide repeats